MRVRSWDIDGFGLFDDLSSGDLPRGLIVVFSPDEDRRNGILGVVRGLLFGLHNGNWPLNGRPDGAGSLVIEGPDGDYRLLRDTNAGPPRLVFPDGHSEAAEEVLRLMGAADSHQLRDVFDVSIAGLRAFASQNGNRETQPGLLPPVTIDSSTSARAVVRTLRQRGAQLFAGDGESRIDRLLHDLEQVESQLRESQSIEAKYEEKIEQERSSRDHVGQLCARLAERRKERERCRLLLDLWPLWKLRAEAADTLASLDPIDAFPDEEMTLLEASRAVAAVEHQLHGLRNERQRDQRALDELKPAGDRYQMRDEVAEICGQLATYRSKLSVFASARARLGELQRLLPESARRVGEEDGSTAFDPARLDLDEARRWHVRSQELAQRQAQTRSALESTRASLKHLRSQQSRALEGEILPQDSLDRRWLSLWQLKAQLDELWEVQSQGEAKARKAEELEHQINTLPQRRLWTPPRWLRPCMWFIVGGAFVGALLMVRKEALTYTMALCGTAVLGMLGDFALGWRMRLSAARSADRRAARDRAQWDLNHAREARDKHWQRASGIASRVRPEAAQLSLSDLPDIDQVESCEADLWRESTDRASIGMLAKTALALKESVDDEHLLAAQLVDLRQAREQADREWEAWKTVVGLPDHLEQDQLTTYLCDFDRWREMRRELERVDADLRRLAPQIEDWEDRSRQTLQKVGVNVTESLCGRDLVDQLTMLRDSTERSEKLRQENLALSESVQRVEQRVAEAEKRLAASRKTLDKLSADSGTTDHAEFERRRQVYEQRCDLRRQIEQQDAALQTRLETIGETGQTEHDIRDSLAEADPERWQESSRQIDIELVDLEADFESASKRQIEAAATCRALEESAGVAALQQQRASLLAEIEEAASEWRKVALAEGLIESTLAEYDRGRHNGLLAAVSDSVKKSTGGRFTRVLPHNGNGGLSLIDREGQRHAVPGDVDRSVAEHLCLSLHLGLVRELSQRSISAPLVLDEVLSDLDEDEARAMAAEVSLLAADHQVLFFTSNRKTLDALSAGGPIARLIEV